MPPAGELEKIQEERAKNRYVFKGTGESISSFQLYDMRKAAYAFDAELRWGKTAT